MSEKQKINKGRFICIIGDAGTVLTLVSGKKVIERVFAASHSVVDSADFSRLLKAYPTFSISILFDCLEQTIQKQVLPAVSVFSVRGLAKQRLEREFAENDIKGFRYLGKEKKGRRDWIFMFAATPQSDYIKEWINFIISFDNFLEGLYMLPLEMESFSKILTLTSSKQRKKVKEKPVEGEGGQSPKKKKEACSWQLLMTHNKASGFRQVVLHNGHVVFTRLIRVASNQMPDAIAGLVEQEAINSIDYLRRLSLESEEQLKTTVIAGEEICSHLKESRVGGNPIDLLTPFEAAKIIGMEGSVSPNDRFCDVLLSGYFTQKRPLLSLHHASVELIFIYERIHTALKLAALSIFPLLCFFIIWFFYQATALKGDIETLENEKSLIQGKWRAAQKTDKYTIEEASYISEAISIHGLLSDYRLPLDIAKGLYQAQKGVQTARTTAINWTYPLVSIGDNRRLTSVIEMDFFDTGKTFEGLFDNFNNFTEGLKTIFGEYDVSHSKLPDQIDFAQKQQQLPLRVELKYPKEELLTKGKGKNKGRRR